MDIPTLRHVSEFYGIEQFSSAPVNLRGLSNTNYELGSHYFLTVFHERQQAEVEFLARLALQVPTSLPLVRPIEGRAGFSTEIEDRPTLLTPRLPGRHYVGIAQSDKYPIPSALHSVLARSFWELQAGLSSVDSSLKAQAEPSAFDSQDLTSTVLPEHIKTLTAYAPDGFEPTTMPKYSDLVHEDLERQNILCSEKGITGVVDLDALKRGDIFYEFCHFLFNNALCDPQATPAQIEIYLDHMEQAGVIASHHASQMYAGVYRFALTDAVEVHSLMTDISPSSTRYIAGEDLAAQYGQALRLAQTVFRGRYNSL